MENKALKEELYSCLCTPPVTLTMTDFAQHRRNRSTWYSTPFYTHLHGYRVCIKVACVDTFVFLVGICLMRGDFDDHLQWPYQGAVYIRILNQQTKYNEHDIITVADLLCCPTDKNVGTQLTDRERQLNVCGSRFFSYASLDGHVKDNTIQLKVTKIVDLALVSRLERQTLGIAELEETNRPSTQVRSHDHMIT